MGGLGYGIHLFSEARRDSVQQQYYQDHVQACKEANQRFLDAREQYQRFQKGELKLYSAPAITSLEEMAAQELYDCDSITPNESCESIDARFPFIRVNKDHGGESKYISRH